MESKLDDKVLNVENILHELEEEYIKELELINIMRKYQKVISVFIGSSLLLDVAIGNKMN